MTTNATDPAAGDGADAVVARAVALHRELTALLTAARSGGVPAGDPDTYAARVEGGIAALEAVLGRPSSM